MDGRLTGAFDIRQDAGIFLTYMGMLSHEDLQAIGTLVDEKLDLKLEPVLEAVREGFESVDRRFEAVDQRFDAVDRRFKNIEDEMESLATKQDLNVLRHELMDHTDRTVQKAVGDLRSELRAQNVIA